MPDVTAFDTVPEKPDTQQLVELLYGRRRDADPRARRMSEADTFARAPNMCMVAVTWLAGIPVADSAVLHLAASLREAELVAAGTASGSNAPTTSRPGPGLPEGPVELRTTLLQEHAQTHAQGATAGSLRSVSRGRQTASSSP